MGLVDILTALPYKGEESSNKDTPWQDSDLEEVPDADAEDAARVDVNNDRVIDDTDINLIKKDR